MDKLTMAHQCAMKLMKLSDQKTIDEVIDLSWCYAEKMVERNKLDQKDSRLLTKDEDGNCLHFHQEFGHKKCMDCGESLMEWQPDWNLAPDWARYWSIDFGGYCGRWYSEEPKKDVLYYQGKVNSLGQDSPNFGYKGLWQESLRKRPE